MPRPEFRIDAIVAWADACRSRSGRWHTRRDGPRGAAGVPTRQARRQEPPRARVAGGGRRGSTPQRLAPGEPRRGRSWAITLRLELADVWPPRGRPLL